MCNGGGGYGVLGLRQINTSLYRYIFLDDDIMHCLLWVFSFYNERIRGYLFNDDITDHLLGLFPPWMRVSLRHEKYFFEPVPVHWFRASVLYSQHTGIRASDVSNGPSTPQPSIAGISQILHGHIGTTLKTHIIWLIPFFIRKRFEYLILNFIPFWVYTLRPGCWYSLCLNFFQLLTVF